MAELKLYGIESYSDYWGQHYRFYSKYNNARGAYHYDRESAVKEGKQHQEIILALHGNPEAVKGE